MKKGPLNKTEKYYIEGEFAAGKTPEEMSEFLGRSEAMVDKYLTSILPNWRELDKEEEAETSTKKNTTQFIRETSEKRSKGVSIMTPEQATQSDDLREGRQRKKSMKNIHKISDNG